MHFCQNCTNINCHDGIQNGIKRYQNRNSENIILVLQKWSGSFLAAVVVFGAIFLAGR